MITALSLVAIAGAVLAVTALAERIRFSAPLLLMLVGIAASFVPFIHEPQLSPEVILLGFLPPLLYSAAIRTSLVDFRTNRRSIGFLSVGLVIFTALGIGLITWLLLPVSFAVAFALGAVVAPPDAVAATSIARRVGLPRRVVTVVEGESLLNDATAITCLRVGIAAIGVGVSAGGVVLGFLLAAVRGVLVGLAVAAVVVPIRRRVQDPVFDTAISFLVPFVAYLPAELLRIPGLNGFHGSGVIAVVTAGLVLGHKSPVIQSGRSRLSERVNWSTVQFLLENTVFLLIGLQARRIVQGMADSSLSGGRIAIFCTAVLVGVIVLRLVWMVAYRLTVMPSDPALNGQLPPWSSTLIAGWAGLRGVVTLAAALLIPTAVPTREVLIFAATVVTVGTLLLQGLTLPGLVRWFGIRGPDSRSDALQAATVLQSASNAALATLENIPEMDGQRDTVAVLRQRIAARPEALWEVLGSHNDSVETPAEQYRRLRMLTLQAEREEVLKIRDTGTIDHDVLEDILASLDLEESMVSIATERSSRFTDEESVPTPADPSGACRHLDEAPHDTEPNGGLVCQDCIREGT